MTLHREIEAHAGTTHPPRQAEIKSLHQDKKNDRQGRELCPDYMLPKT
jgi:hypothetical protein